MELNQIFSKLWDIYTTQNPSVQKVYDIFTKEADDGIFRAVVTRDLCVCIHDVADDAPLLHRNKIQLSDEAAALAQYMRQKVLITSRYMMIPERFSRDIFHFAIIGGRFQPDCEIAYHIRPSYLSTASLPTRYCAAIFVASYLYSIC